MTSDRQAKVILTIIAVALVWRAASDWSTPIAAQTAPPPQAQASRPPVTDVNAALLAEVRALRSEVAEAARNSLRAQLLVARAQVQEQRLLNLDRRRAEGAAKVAEAEERTRRVNEETIRMGTALETFPTASPGGATLTARELAERRAEIEMSLRAAQAELDAMRAEEQRVRIEQADVEAAIATEHSRWNDFNARLDQLDRSLPR